MMASAHALLMEAVETDGPIGPTDREAVLWLVADGHARIDTDGRAWPTRRGVDYVMRHRAFLAGVPPHRCDTS